MDGLQKKSYIHAKDCIEGMLLGVGQGKERFNLFNLGTGDRMEVKDIAKTLLKEVGLSKTKIIYTGGSRGWEGDVPQMLLDITKIKKLGWRPKYNFREAIIQTIKENI